MNTAIDRKNYGDLLKEYQPQVINSEEEYNRALESIERLMHWKDRPPAASALLKLLVFLVENYEENVAPINDASPLDVLLYLMDAKGIKQSNLVGILGSKGVVSEIVNGKRAISKDKAKALSEFFNVSAELFI